MSTITKLDPTVRQRRAERRNALQFFERNRSIATEVGKFCISAWAHMVALRNDPGSTGARKHLIASRVIAQFEALRGPVRVA